jgi:predicted acetyltransferase
MTAKDGTVAVPYTVWSREKGAGKRIVRKVIENVRDTGMAERVVTLSPLTEMARRFHLRNGAKELQVNEDTVNFEYQVKVI